MIVDDGDGKPTRAVKTVQQVKDTSFKAPQPEFDPQVPHVEDEN